MSISFDPNATAPVPHRPAIDDLAAQAGDIAAKARSLVRPEGDSVGIGQEAKARSQAPAPAPSGELDEQKAGEALESVASTVSQGSVDVGHTLDPERVAELISL